MIMNDGIVYGEEGSGHAHMRFEFFTGVKTHIVVFQVKTL
jgi:hypothetical protein